MFDLTDKVAFITGGSRGIGRAIGMRLAQQGANVVINYVRQRRIAEETATAIENQGGQCIALRGNVANEEDVIRMYREIQSRYGHIDFLVSNAASGVLKPVTDLTTRHWDWAMDINARALLTLSREGRSLMAPGARIIAVSSIGAVRAIPNYAAVGASKAALESLVRHLAVELGPSGIHVNTISAGAVDTDALKKFPNRDTILNTALSKTPLGRLTTPEDVANLALFLCSDLSTMIHGQTLVIDGGFAIQS